MVEIVNFNAGGYRYSKAVFQYSGGVSAQPGFEIERARFHKAVPLADGFAAVEAHLKRLGRPTTAFCACELRSPEPFTEQGFVEFNRHYVKTLERWGIYKDEMNPVARTNVCPEYDKPAVPSLYAFSYTVPTTEKRKTFVISGGGDRGGPDNRVIRLGDTSPEGLREKIRFVVGEMEKRLAALGFSWSDAATTRMYTVHDVGALVGEELFKRGVAPAGIEWHFTRPPVVNLVYEMDVQAPARQVFL